MAERNLKEKSNFVSKILDEINHNYSFKLNVEDVFCNSIVAKKCIAHDEKNLFFIDNNHLSSFSAKIITQKIYEIISKIN